MLVRKAIGQIAKVNRPGASSQQDAEKDLRERLSKLDAEREQVFQESIDRWQRDFEEAEEARHKPAATREERYRASAKEASEAFAQAQAEQSRGFEASHEKRAEATSSAANARQRLFDEQESAHLAHFQRQRDSFAERVRQHADLRLSHEREVHRQRVALWDDTKSAVKECLGSHVKRQDELFADAEAARDARTEDVLKGGPCHPRAARQLMVTYTDLLQSLAEECQLKSNSHTQWQAVPHLNSKAHDMRQAYMNRDYIVSEEKANPPPPQPEAQPASSSSNDSRKTALDEHTPTIDQTVPEVDAHPVSQPARPDSSPASIISSRAATPSTGLKHIAWQMLIESEACRDSLAKAEEDRRQQTFNAEEATRDAMLEYMRSAFTALEQRFDAAYQEMTRDHDKLEELLQGLADDEESERDERFRQLQIHTSGLFEASLDAAWQFATVMCDTADQELGILVDTARQLGARTNVVAHSRRFDMYEKAQTTRELKLGFSVSKDNIRMLAGGQNAVSPKHILIVGLEPRALLRFDLHLHDFIPTARAGIPKHVPSNFEGFSYDVEIPLIGNLMQWCEAKQERREKLSADASLRRAREFQRKDALRLRQFERDQMDRADRLASSVEAHARHFAAGQRSRQLRFLEREKDLAKRSAERLLFQERVLMELRQTLEGTFKEELEKMNTMWGEQASERNGVFQMWLVKIWALAERQAVNTAESFVVEDKARQRRFECLLQHYMEGDSSLKVYTPKVEHVEDEDIAASTSHSTASGTEATDSDTNADEVVSLPSGPDDQSLLGSATSDGMSQSDLPSSMAQVAWLRNTKYIIREGSSRPSPSQDTQHLTVEQTDVSGTARTRDSEAI